MEIKPRIALGVLSLALSIAPAFGQGQAQNPPPPQQEQAQPAGPGGVRFGRQAGGPGGPGGPQMDGRSFRGPMGRRFGQRGRMGFGGRGMGARGLGGDAGFLSNPAVRQRLGITADQMTKFHQQDLDFQKAQIRDRADLQVKRIELNELLNANTPDRAAIDAKLQEVSAAQMASEKAAIDNRLAMRDILTPAQRQQLEQFRANGMQQGNGAAQAGPRPPAARGGGGAGRGPRPGGTPPPPGQTGQPPANQ